MGPSGLHVRTHTQEERGHEERNGECWGCLRGAEKGSWSYMNIHVSMYKSSKIKKRKRIPFLFLALGQAGLESKTHQRKEVDFKLVLCGQAWRHTPRSPALWRQRQRGLGRSSRPSSATQASLGTRDHVTKQNNIK